MSEFKAKTIAEISAHCINFDYALQNEYNKLLQAYTTTRAELATVKAELDRGKWQPITDELPITEVLCIDQWSEYHIGYLSKTPDGIFICESDTEILENPTHYKLLPTPPHKN